MHLEQVALVDEFFEPWEGDPIASFDEINEVILEVFERWIAQGSHPPS
jgi:hypothetical protein